MRGVCMHAIRYMRACVTRLFLKHGFCPKQLLLLFPAWLPK